MSVVDHPARNLVEESARPAYASSRVTTALAFRRAAASAIGQFAVVVAIVFTVLASSEMSAAIVPETLVAAAIWFAGLRSVYANNWVSPLVVGGPIASIAGAVVGLAGVSAAATLIPWLDIDGPQVLLMAVGVAVGSSVYELVLDHRLWPRRRLVIVGAQRGELDLRVELSEHPELGFDDIGVLHETDDARRWRFRGQVEELSTVIERERPDLVVLAGVSDRDLAIEQLVDAAGTPFQLVDVHHFYEHAFGRVPLQNLSPAWFMSVLHLYRQRYSRFSKRAFDICLAVVALIVVAPLLPLVALLVRASGPGPVLFRQVRLGEGGKPFEIFKFRTMVADAERDGIAIWAAEDDPRITPVGRLLRRTRLDELPQIWNVLIGEMSIVGPRPERPEFLEKLAEEVPFWTRRHLVKPGITGWAQLQRGYTTDALGAAEKLSYDLYYLRHRSLLLDLAITAKTAAIVVTGSGAH